MGKIFSNDVCKSSEKLPYETINIVVNGNIVVNITIYIARG